jgi:type IV pilus assembly protein PilE
VICINSHARLTLQVGVGALRRKRSRGFTLIELMITVVIVAILASIAYPNYSEYVERAARRDAIAVMLEAQQFAERRFTEQRSYAGVDLALPASLNRSPKDSPTPRYTITFTNVTPTTYVVNATFAPAFTPKKCGNLSVNQIGVRTISNTVGSTVADCF